MIQAKPKKCKGTCGKVTRIFSHGLCLNCWKKENKSKVTINKFSEKGKIKKEEKTLNTKKLHEWFQELWDKTENASGYCTCYETGIEMHRCFFRNDTCCYHHVLEKAKYPQFAFSEWNVVIVLPVVHKQVHDNIDKTPRIKILTEELKLKY